MKLKDSYNEIMAEKIAEVALLRTGLVNNIQPSLEPQFDMIAYQKDSPNQIIFIEVKQVKSSKEEIEKAYRSFRNELVHFKEKDKTSVLLFLIDAEKESGYFVIFDERHNENL